MSCQCLGTATAGDPLSPVLVPLTRGPSSLTASPPSHPDFALLGTSLGPHTGPVLLTWPQAPSLRGRISVPPPRPVSSRCAPPPISPTGWVEKETYY